MDCKHQFIAIEGVARHREVTLGGHKRFDNEIGTRAGCILCGQIRTIWQTGELIIQPPHENKDDTINPGTKKSS